jgi:hypothetical protein
MCRCMQISHDNTTGELWGREEAAVMPLHATLP